MATHYSADRFDQSFLPETRLLLKDLIHKKLHLYRSYIKQQRLRFISHYPPDLYLTLVKQADQLSATTYPELSLENYFTHQITTSSLHSKLTEHQQSLFHLFFLLAHSEQPVQVTVTPPDQIGILDEFSVMLHLGSRGFQNRQKKQYILFDYGDFGKAFYNPRNQDLFFSQVHELFQPEIRTEITHYIQKYSS